MQRRAIVAIVGRPNVGKSTLFNRILGRRQALVHDVEGVTRDRHLGRATWNDVDFDLVDTGGLLPRSRDVLETQVRDAVLAAIDAADLLLLVVDVNVGITELDQEIGARLRRSGKQTLLVANKADDDNRALLAGELHRLGLGEPQPVSAVHGRGFGDLLDRVVAALPDAGTPEPHQPAELAIAIIGKPNVGKSSLLNALLREERVLVSEQPGTTRDAIDSRLRWHGHEIDIIDTAGLRKRSRVTEAVEAFAAIRALRSIERADVCVLVLDATQPMSHQDTHIAGHAHDAGRGIVAVFNKWDAVDKEADTATRFERDFRDTFAFVRYAPVLFVSAATKQRVHTVLETAWRVQEARSQQVATVRINQVLEAATQRNPPHFHRGGNGQVKYGVQIGTCPPRFAVYVNNPLFFDRNYVRYLNNSLRAAFPFRGSALRIELRPSPRGRAAGNGSAPRAGSKRAGGKKGEA